MRILVRVDDVGRRPGDSPTDGTDHNLSYFREWRSALGDHCCGIYGVVPSWVDREAVERLRGDLKPGEQIAQHGWDHVPGRVDLGAMKAGQKKLGPCEAYIPPFNAYDILDLLHWRRVGGKVFLGGFFGEHHFFSQDRCLQGGIWHYPAERPLYGRAPALAKVVAGLADKPDLLVLTLHVPWDVGFAGLEELGSVLRGRAVPLSEDVLNVA